ncbi:helix-turn-helix transcriptional regulator [Pasteurella multocida]|uniref:helix-turn-helix transcriptional regulator n=1 Tax=Pasteurella multocida TaxID=747 RepID=UPI002023280F|nr:WYL domain-containing protein [Pasteurella multocida]URH80034.1 WYL domain-containing protein [Pasteurella multocida]HDR1040550.1 WYL domain-containing protein [Pasteurella multocida]HDR1141748.1 WYL domain-containing protein [Pasteurella multocida]HDR1143295.1 WYL domain-containing protein [Pasteurella multocida]HDR1145389.1 WYL domain-containing protein [Pasteurella multocida]
MSETKHERVALRLAIILQYLIEGRRLKIDDLAEEFQVSKRTIQKDLNERLAFLEWKENSNGYYSIDLSQLGILTKTDIQRFARFASVQELFPNIDRSFYQENLLQSVQVKGFQYENIKPYEHNFKTIQQAIEQQRKIQFFYTKANEKMGKTYQLEPYSLINKNGIWYVIGLDNNKEKTFCFTQIKTLLVKNDRFETNSTFLQKIQNSDSISHGNQISEVIIKVSAKVAPYFQRRNLLPNQEILKKLDDGSLLLQCKHINEMEILPLVQYWIPHLTVISPEGLQGKLVERLKEYLNNVI